MTETRADAPNGAAVAPLPTQRRALLWLLLLVNTAFGAGLLLAFWRQPPVATQAETAGPAADAGAPAAKPAGLDIDQPGPMVKLDGFVIQLRTADGERHARVAFDLEIADESDRRAVEGRFSRMRDAIIVYFSDRTIEELQGSENLEHAKAGLLRRFDDLVPGHCIRGLFMTDFVVQ
jgi:flagellar FliL protein